MKNITILGATGSIGLQSLAVIDHHNQLNCDKNDLPDYHVFALTAFKQSDKLFDLCLKHKPEYAVIVDINNNDFENLKQKFSHSNINTKLLHGADYLAQVASSDEVDIVISAIVGGAGLKPTHAAVKSGKKILLANKESLVMTGKLLLSEAEKYQSTILPVDSEHNALFQCMPALQGFRKASLTEAGINKLLLTGSGGPFRQTPLAELENKTPEQACKHPNWEMGKKISIDSATMMNKGLEFIEACLLFNANPEQIDVIIHPQSIIHSLVQYKDGSSIAQIGYSDMRVPIANALSYPKRIDSGVNDIDLSMHNFSFESVDYNRYPCLQLAKSVALDNSATVIMNAANEIAVEAFITNKIKFTQIYDVVAKSIDKTDKMSILDIDDVLILDKLSREQALSLIN